MMTLSYDAYLEHLREHDIPVDDWQEDALRKFFGRPNIFLDVQIFFLNNGKLNHLMSKSLQSVGILAQVILAHAFSNDALMKR